MVLCGNKRREAEAGQSSLVWVLAEVMENLLGEGFLKEGLPFSFFEEREILAVTVLQLLKTED